MNMVKQLLQFALKFVIFNLLKGTFLMKFKDGKTFSAYVRSNLHSGYITLTPTSSFSEWAKEQLVSKKEIEKST